MTNPTIQTARLSRSLRAVPVDHELFEMVAIHRAILADTEVGSGRQFSGVLADSCARGEICLLDQKLGLEVGS
jgi:hypothetical protein